MTKAAYEYPLQKSLWIPNVTITACKYYFWLLFVPLQLFPSMVIDTILKLMGKKTFLMYIQRMAFYTRATGLFFLKRQYDSDGPTDIKEMARLTRGTEFSVDDYLRYEGDEEAQNDIVRSTALGCRRYLLNEPDSTIEQCRKVLRGKTIAYNIFRCYVVFILLRAAVRYFMEHYM